MHRGGPDSGSDSRQPLSYQATYIQHLVGAFDMQGATAPLGINFRHEVEDAQLLEYQLRVDLGNNKGYQKTARVGHTLGQKDVDVGFPPNSQQLVTLARLSDTTMQYSVQASD